METLKKGDTMHSVIGHFVVYGKPQPRGSKSPIPGQRRDGSLYVAVRDSNSRSGPYMKRVAEAASQEMRGKAPTVLPVTLSIVFYLARPKRHYRTGRFSNLLREDAPVYHTQKPDLSKLIRGVEDAMSGVAYVDDQQIVCHAGSQKKWCHPGDEKTVVTIEVEL